MIDQLLTSLFARGHCLFVGVPGLAKTLLISTLAEVLDLSFNRIQFTPDLMPSDITGTDVLEEDHATGRRVFRFIRGPLFANIVLADEINRTPPKTQAALLQAMQEQRVTAGGQTHVLAAAVPRLRHAEPDRAGGHLSRCPRRSSIASCSRSTSAIRRRTRRSPSSSSRPAPIARSTKKVLSPERIMALQELVLRVPVADHVVRYAVALVRATRPAESTLAVRQARTSPSAPGRARRSTSSSAPRPRRSSRGGRRRRIEDVRALAHPTLQHRMITNFHAEAEGIRPRAIIDRLLESVRP